MPKKRKIKNGPLNRSTWEIIKDVITFNGKKSKKNMDDDVEEIRKCSTKLEELNQLMDRV